MQPEDIEKAIIRAAYSAYFAGESSVGLHDIRAALGADEQVFEQVVDSLENHGRIKGHAMGWHNKITPHGIISAEESGIVDADVTETNEQTRTKILDYLAKASEAERHHHGRPYEQLASDIGIALPVVRPNLLLLTDFDYVEARGGGVFRISGTGIQAVTEWRRKTAIIQEFEDLEMMKPQARGRAFQQLFARQVGDEGWEQEEGARTSNEEMDVILHKNGTYYIVECKWEKKAIEAPVVRELFGKLRNRAEVRGIIVSMSGFSAGAIKQVHDYSGQATIVLFGPEDTRAIFHFDNTFDELLTQKLRELVVRRKVTFK
jgi:hypothetical protein